MPHFPHRDFLMSKYARRCKRSFEKLISQLIIPIMLHIYLRINMYTYTSNLPKKIIHVLMTTPFKFLITK